jgi:hypothetical protein
MALQSNDVESARGRPDVLSVSAFARIGILAAATVVPLNGYSSPKGLCEEYRRETMAMVVEQVLRAKDAGSSSGTRAVRPFETSMLDRVMSTDCDVQEAVSP